ncbi:MAG: ClpXP protease specificity-enhancing factor [Gammaproteobacteria bacterium]|nr:MAG: ClpXP protease specificity-enhancing factor [Gammaproteobacteria bacterium]
MTSRRPYLLRAMHEWMTDNAFTPHVVIDAEQPGVDVPRQFVSDGRIVLNVSLSATHGLAMGNDALSFNARFGGQPQHVHVPMAAVLGIYARETGQGMLFTDEDGPDGPPDPDGPPGGLDGADGGDSTTEGGDGRRAHLKIVK